MSKPVVHKLCHDVTISDWKWVLCTENVRPDPYRVVNPPEGESAIQVRKEIATSPGWAKVTCKKCLRLGKRF